MPRTRAQQDAHNVRRRQIKQEGRKAIVCMRYIKLTHPQKYNEACEFFTVLNERYPQKRDLTKTSEFMALKQTPGPNKNITMVEPQLEITLMGNATVENTNTPLDMTDETFDLVIQELRQDPDIATAFDQIMQHPDIVTIDQGIQPQFTNEEQDLGIQQQITIEELQQDQLQSTSDESEAIEQIIQELRQDPDLNKAFDELELQLEFDQLGEDLPELDEIIW